MGHFQHDKYITVVCQALQVVNVFNFYQPQTCQSKCWLYSLNKATNHLTRGEKILKRFVDFGPLFHYFGHNGNIF